MNAQQHPDGAGRARTPGEMVRDAEAALRGLRLSQEMEQQNGLAGGASLGTNGNEGGAGDNGGDGGGEGVEEGAAVQQEGAKKKKKKNKNKKKAKAPAETDDDAQLPWSEQMDGVEADAQAQAQSTFPASAHVPVPAANHTRVDDDAASVGGESQVSQTRRAKRGGRKKKSKSALTQLLAEDAAARTPWAEQMAEADGASVGSESAVSARPRGGRKAASVQQQQLEQQQRDRLQPRLMEHVEPEPVPWAGVSEGGFEAADAASVGGESQASARSAHKRGGRKKKNMTTNKSRMAPLEEAQPQPQPQVPWSERTGRLEPLPEAPVERERVQSPAPAPKRKEKEKEKEPFRTGVQAFNLRRAADSTVSSDRPIGVNVERAGEGKGKGKKKKGKEGEESSDEEEQEKRRPVSIRLDLNLEVEIFLKAAIKGDVTITFLD